MLQRLTIQNYAIIENIDISFSDKLNIITGETGAGKSILIGALSLILGERVDMRVLYNKGKKCVVEGYFDIQAYGLKDFFSANDLDYADVAILRREIAPTGKSRSFINDTPVNLSMLKELGERLVDIHAQHETLELRQTLFHLAVIDACAGHGELLEQYQRQFRRWQQTLQQLQEIEAQNRQAETDKDYYNFLLEELQAAHLSDGEQEVLEQELSVLENAESISATLAQAIRELETGDTTLIAQLETIRHTIGSLKKFHHKLEELYGRLNTTLIELKDMVYEMQRVEQSVHYDPQRLQAINERLNVIYRLQKKHKVNNIGELLNIQQLLSEKVQGIRTLSEEIVRMKQEAETQYKELVKMAEQLSQNRKKHLIPFETSINSMLVEVGMPYARIQVQHHVETELNTYGKDRIMFLFSPDTGKHYIELHRVASGGELSRLMLCIQSLVAKKMTLPTIIFDEIDMGISGEVAFQVGKMLEQLSATHQVICITHLPQIASKGESHYFVYKENAGKKTVTRLKLLNHDERIMEIARMLGGEKPTKVAVENAKELLGG